MAVLRKTKPVVVSMSDVAASGGYYISMGADAIVAQPGTITGSIGVVSGQVRYQGPDGLDRLPTGDPQAGTERRPLLGLRQVHARAGEAHPGTDGGLLQDLRHARPRRAGRRPTTRSTMSRRGASGPARRPSRSGWWTAWAVSIRPSPWPRRRRKSGRTSPCASRSTRGPSPSSRPSFRTGRTIWSAARALSQLPPELVQIYRDYESIRPMASEPFVLYTPARVRM